MSEKSKIYLAGSFYDFRDRIISELGDSYEFSDPRNNRQNAIAANVEDDINSSLSCPIFLACFPKGKSRGTMTYAEAGASRTKGNYMIIADETGQKDNFLEKIVDNSFDSIDGGSINNLHLLVPYILHNIKNEKYL